MAYKEILSRVYFGNTVCDYLIACAALLTSFLVISLVIRLIIKHIKKFAEATTAKIDDFIVEVLEKVAVPFLYLFAVYISVKSLSFHPYVEKGANYAGLAIVVFFVARLIIMVTGYGMKAYLTRSGYEEGLERSLRGLLVVAKLLVWGGATIFFLDNLGFKISAVIAGLGIGGVAVALAAQTILKDLFSYFSIIFDQPFKVGDFIIVNDYMGTIEHVGIKTTRIRSLSGEILIFSNSDLTDSRLRNYKLMEKRRVVFKLGVVYQTSLERLKEIPVIIEKIIKSIGDTVFDRAHFFSYGDSSLVFEVVYYVAGADYNKYMDIQQKVNLAIFEEFAKKGIEFAYPTQTLYVNKVVGA